MPLLATGGAPRIGYEPEKVGLSGGFIEYDGFEEEDRDAARSCISLIIGRPIVPIGEVTIGPDGPIGHRGYSPRGWLSLCNSRAYAPAPLAAPGSFVASPKVFSQMLDALLAN